MSDKETEYVGIPGTPRDTDPLHMLLQDHIQSCPECTEAVRSDPRGFGQRGRMCREYFGIISAWSGVNLP